VEHPRLRKLMTDQGSFCQSLYSLLFNALSPKSFGTDDDDAAYLLASTAQLKSVSVYLPTREALVKANASKVLQESFHMPMVSSSLGLHHHYGDDSRHYDRLHALLIKATKNADGTRNYKEAVKSYWIIAGQK